MNGGWFQGQKCRRKRLEKMEEREMDIKHLRVGKCRLLDRRVPVKFRYL